MGGVRIVLTRGAVFPPGVVCVGVEARDALDPLVWLAFQAMTRGRRRETAWSKETEMAIRFFRRTRQLA